MRAMGGRRFLASVITELSAPAPLTALVIAIVAWHSASTPAAAIGWALVGGAFAPLLPLAHLIRQVRAGHVSDHHVAVRGQRPRILAIALLSVTVGLLLLTILGAPGALLALFIAGASAITTAMVVSLWWKMSVHMVAVGGILTVCAILFGPGVLVLLPLVPLVAWSRIELAAHTPAQVVVGAVIGASVSGGVFTLVSHLL